MPKSAGKAMALVMAALLSVTALTGCGGNNPAPASATPTPSAGAGEQGEAEKNYWELLDTVSDTSELPDWKGEVLELRIWYSHGTTWGERKKSEADVVLKEIQRVTGIRINVDGSFDNNGMDIKAKLPTMIAANDYPDLVYNGQMINLVELIKGDKLYDLTEAFPEYCTSFTDVMPMDKFSEFYSLNHLYNGRQYTLPAGVGAEYFYSDNSTYPQFDFERWKTNMLTTQSKGGSSGVNYLWVRDDILKALYPQAKTMAEIEAIYGSKGTFTKDELFDIPLNNLDDVVEMLYAIKDHIKAQNITENGKPVQVTYGPAVGQDNWYLFTILPTLIDGALGNTNYFTQFNKATGKLEYAYKMDYVKNEMKVYNRLQRDNVLAQDSLVDSVAMFTEKVNNAQYAVLYGQNPPNVSLKEAGKAYAYRPVWVDQAYRTEQQVQFMQQPIGTAWAIFKDSVKEEDLPQVLRFFNYLYSDVGDKLRLWGPESAGLWEEKDGKRVFVDKELEEAMVYGKDNGKNLYYGLVNSYLPTTSNTFPNLPTLLAPSVNHPVYVYDKAVNVNDAIKKFNPGILPGMSFQDGLVTTPKLPNVYNYQADVEEVSRFWKARDGFEKQLTKIVASGSDAQFEEQYNALLKYAESNGLTDATLEELNKVYLEINGNALKEAGLIK